MHPEDRWEPWPPPDVIHAGGPDSTILDPDDLSRLNMPTTGRVGFTVPLTGKGDRAGKQDDQRRPGRKGRSGVRKR